MQFLTSIVHEKFKKNFFVIFVLASTIPLLLMICITYLYVLPLLLPEQIAGLKTIFTYGVLIMLLPPLLSFILGSRWVSSVESISEEIKAKSVQIMGEHYQVSDDNEFSVIHQSFNELHGELQNKMSMLNEVSKKLTVWPHSGHRSPRRLLPYAFFLWFPSCKYFFSKTRPIASGIDKTNPPS